MSLANSFVGKSVMNALSIRLLKSNILFALEIGPETDYAKALEAVKKQIRQNSRDDLLIIVIKQ